MMSKPIDDIYTINISSGICNRTLADGGITESF